MSTNLHRSVNQQDLTGTAEAWKGAPEPKRLKTNNKQTKTIIRNEKAKSITAFYQYLTRWSPGVFQQGWVPSATEHRMKFESRTFRFHGNALTYSDRRKGKVYCEVRRKVGDNYPIICDFCKYCSIGGKLKQNDGFKCRS